VWLASRRQRLTGPLLGLGDAEELDLGSLEVRVSTDVLAIDRDHRLEVLVVVGDGHGRDEDADGGRDDGDEADRHVQLLPCLLVMRRSVARRAGLLGSEGHR
jgi:hypothetical protein